MKNQNQGNKSFSMLDQVFEDGQKEELSKQLKNISICPFCDKKLDKPFDEHLIKKHEEIEATAILNKIEEVLKNFASISSYILFLKFVFDVRAKAKKPTPQEKIRYRNAKEEVNRISNDILYDLA